MLAQTQELESDNHCLPSVPVVLSLEEVVSILKSTRKGAAGPDGIPFRIFRHFNRDLAASVLHVFQLSLDTGVVPDAFKVDICPVPKVANLSPEEYRPISLLPILSKLLERVVIKRRASYLVGDINPLQCAFVPRVGLGTTAALTYTMH